MIEHPDHTGASANPLAPWNQPDADVEECVGCGDDVEITDDNVDDDERLCPSCIREQEGPSDEEVWGAAEAASLSPLPDTRDEHDPTL